LGAKEIREYQLLLLDTRKRSASLVRILVCALRFLYGVTLSRDVVVQEIPYPRRPKKLPVVPSLEETARFLDAVPGARHRMILRIAYDAGLRISEVLNLRVQDIDSQRMLLCVRGGKGDKDRNVPLSLTLLQHLREYWKAFRPKAWLFPAEGGMKPLSPSCVQKACKKAQRRANLAKRITPHSLRHAYTTHLLEAGANPRALQEALGHNSLKTTTHYMHLTANGLRSLKSPLDLLPPTPPAR
jgi:site-specific recombinase XerD